MLLFPMVPVEHFVDFRRGHTNLFSWLQLICLIAVVELLFSNFMLYDLEIQYFRKRVFVIIAIILPFPLYHSATGAGFGK